MEGLSHNYESINNNEGIKEQNIPSFNDVENNIKQNYENNLGGEGSSDLGLNRKKWVAEKIKFSHIREIKLI
jgi:hypothetical protein